MRYGDRERKDGLRRTEEKKTKKKFQTHITQKRHAICFPLNEEKKALFSFFVSLILCSFSLGEKKRNSILLLPDPRYQISSRFPLINCPGQRIKPPSQT